MDREQFKHQQTGVCGIKTARIQQLLALGTTSADHTAVFGMMELSEHLTVSIKELAY